MLNNIIDKIQNNNLFTKLKNYLSNNFYFNNLNIVFVMIFLYFFNIFSIIKLLLVYYTLLFLVNINNYNDFNKNKFGINLLKFWMFNFLVEFGLTNIFSFINNSLINFVVKSILVFYLYNSFIEWNYSFNFTINTGITTDFKLTKSVNIVDNLLNGCIIIYKINKKIIDNFVFFVNYLLYKYYIFVNNYVIFYFLKNNNKINTKNKNIDLLDENIN